MLRARLPLLLACLFMRSTTLADSYTVAEFIESYRQAHGKSYLETPSPSRFEIPKPKAQEFLRAELAYLADERGLLPIARPSAESREGFFMLRANLFKLIEAGGEHQGAEWSGGNPMTVLKWHNNGNLGPSWMNAIVQDTPLKHADGRTVQVRSTLSFSGHTQPPLSKFSRSWLISHEIKVMEKPGAMLSHLTMESTVSEARPSIQMRLRSNTLNRELFTVLTKPFGIFPVLTDAVSRKIINALIRARLIL